MDSQASVNNDRSRTRWTSPMDRYFIDLMLDQISAGSKGEQGFGRQAWVDMTAKFNTKFGLQFDKDILKNRHKTLKKLYNSLKTLLGLSGFGWDEQRHMVTADDLVWEDYIKAHPDAANASGKYSQTCHNLVDEPIRTETVAQNVPDEEPLDEEASMDVGVDNQQMKRRSSITSTQHVGKTRHGTSEGIVGALNEMAAAFRSYATKEGNTIKALRQVSDIDEDLFLRGTELLEDDKKGRSYFWRWTLHYERSDC
ncbi:uncharacterized protein LOC143888873 [Tasmannia lanceolata]|uniref:uncharacterized protein LOC143888873 n=1 Tax=Tasmannia lanceolata TaxID=3420 RepID=UPI00406447E3